jgi:hypothetical protein
MMAEAVAAVVAVVVVQTGVACQVKFEQYSKDGIWRLKKVVTYEAYRDDEGIAPKKLNQVYEVVDVSNQVDVGNIENEKDVHATD